MYRRRRTSIGEVAFSFDSFLDLVANVIGIIIRLILVAWVGARTYHGVVDLPAEEQAALADKTQETRADPMANQLEQQLARTQKELEQARAGLYEKLHLLGEIEDHEHKAGKEFSALAVALQDVTRERQKLERAVAGKEKALSAPEYTMAELRQRSRSLLQQIEDVKKMPLAKKTLRYHTPVSRPVHTDELMFECCHGRVTFIDLPAFMAEIQRGMEDKAALLRSRWQVVETTAPVGAFRMRYAIERQRDTIDSVLDNSRPTSNGFRYGLAEWTIEPVQDPRGETLEKALANGSEFRQITAAGVPEQTVVTFWVYPDSFVMFRQLRDYLYERGLEVAGRPLPEHTPIAASQHGTRSRGQ